MFYGPFGGVAIAFGKPCHQWVLPLGGTVGKEQAREDRGEEKREDERAEQSKAYHPGHRLEETTFDSLQRKDRQVRGDDHAACEEDRTLYFVRGLADLLGRRERVLALVAEVADDVLHHDDGAVYDHAEVQCSEGEEVCWNVQQIEADC